MKPQWRKEELADLEKKLAKTRRRITMPKTVDPNRDKEYDTRWRARYKRLEGDLTDMIKIMRGWDTNAPAKSIPVDASWPESIAERLKSAAAFGAADRKLTLEDNVKKLGKVKAWLQMEQ